MQYRDSLSAVVPASGAVIIPLTPNGTLTYVVRQVSLERNDAPLGATCYLRINGRDVTPLINSGDTAAGEPPTWVYPGDRLTLEFAGYTPGMSLTGTFFYDKENR